MACLLLVVLLAVGNLQTSLGTTPTYLLPLEEDCTQTYSNNHALNITCAPGHELFRLTSLDSYYNARSSCASCQCAGYTGTDPNSPEIPAVEKWNYAPNCCPGFNGTECDICSSLAACPPLRVPGKNGANDTFVEATMCTNDRMVPANLLEADMGKKFSCYCGGGEDSLSQSACNAQGQYKEPTGSYNPDTGTPLVTKGATVTRFDWTFHGTGSDDSPGSISLAMNAGIHGNTWAEDTDGEEFRYFYPVVWSGTLDECVITEGNCMDVYGTDVKNQQCYNYDCGNTEINCPPKGLPSCPGGANNCGVIPGTDVKYQMQKCNVLPSNGIGFKISCLKDTNPDSTYVCYYAQPGGYAPLSMTCNVGNCLYNNSAAIGFSDTKIDTPRGVAYQESLLIIMVGGIMGLALAVELIRQGREVRKEKSFRKHQRRLAAESAAASRQLLNDAETTGNPLLGGGKGGRSNGGGDDDDKMATAAGTAVVLSGEGEAAAAVKDQYGNDTEAAAVGSGSGGDDDGTGGGRMRSESADSGYDERQRYQGAVLSWHNMKLWVPAKASDQLNNLHAATKLGLEAFQRDLQQGIGDLQQNGLMDQVVLSPLSSPRSPNNDEEMGGGGSTRNPVLLPAGSPGSPPPNDEAAGGAHAPSSRHRVGATDEPDTLGGDGEHSLEKQILRGVSGTARRGSLTALMGPSGAGKTSLLDCLAARKPMHRVQGLVTVNGRPCPPSTMRNVSGYVAQHDVLPGVLTVREHLLFHARLRCPSSMGDRARRQRVEDVIHNLGLVKCADTVIGNEFKRGLSGGEKRRVSVAEELVVEPGILFLDEPTTGLDSTTAMSICKTLGDIAKRGTTVLLSIHQPREDIFDLFDRVLVLCIGGRVVFEGPTALVPRYLRRSVEMELVHDPKVNLFLSHHFNANHVAEAGGGSGNSSGGGGGGGAGGGDGAGDGMAVTVLDNDDQQQRQQPATTSKWGDTRNNKKRKKKKKRLANPADLLLDVASCSKCNELADAFDDHSFQDGIPDWNAGGQQQQGRGRNSRSSSNSSAMKKEKLVHHSEWEDALGPLVEQPIGIGGQHHASHHHSAFATLELSDDEQGTTSPSRALNSTDSADTWGGGGGGGNGGGDHEEDVRALSAAMASGGSAGHLNYEDPNPVRGLLNEAFMCCGLMARPPVDNFFPPRHVASPLLQLLVLSERLVKTATRHPMLVLLQYAGALFLAVCLGFIFQDVPDDLYGVQDRFGLLFFLPFCLVLLGMSSLPVWRDEHILFTHEQGNKRIYGFPAYFLSVLCFDLILVRTIPPTFFALITYNMVGLNQHCDACLLYFAIILILTNVISALIAMAVGAFRFSTSFSNLVGALLALLFALFAGFLVSKKGHQNLFVFYLDPMAYSYEALMINQFGNQLTNDGNEYFYVINGSWCAKGLETVYPTGNQLLSTFGFSNSQHDMNADIYALWTGALYCTALAFGVLVASAQAPYYSAAWQRFCQVSPLGLVAALFAAGFKALGAQFRYLLGRGASGGDSGGSGAGGSGGGRGDVGASLASAGGDSLVSNSSFVSTSSPTRGPAFEKLAAHESGGPHHHDLDTDNDSQEGGGGVVNRNRTASEGSGSFEVASDDEYEADEFPDQPRRRVVSFQDEDPEALAAARSQEDEEEEADNHGSSSSSNRYARAKQHSPAAAAGSPESMASSSSGGGGGGGQGQWPANDEDDGEDEARKKALKALLRRQLRNPLGGDDAAGVRRNPEHLAPPMVLSFHSICLSVPHPPNLSKSLKRMTGADILDKEQTAAAAAAAQQQMGGSGNASPMEVVPLSATLDASEAGLGMNVMRHPQSGLAVVRKVMPGSWAQRKGVRPGDSVVGVGATRVTNYDQLTPTLRSAPRPVRVHFLRRRKAAATLSAEAAAARQAKLFRGSAWGDRLSGLASAVGLGGPRYDPFGGPQNHKALKPILKSVSGSTLSSHRVVKPPPSSSSSMGGHGNGGVPQLRSLIAPSAQASAQAHAQATASAQATAAVRASERLPAMVCGIMGPSGAGKTSLLDVLAGRKTVGTVTGVVRLNGRAMSPKEMRLLSGYVVQEDILPAMLTVRECLDFQARLRVPSSVPGGASGRVEAVLKRMKLVRTASTIVGGSFQRGISGGEKRRLSVAIELLSEPAVLFLDEPTTGQDSTTAVMLCKALKKIARDGTTVVMSIHQPRVDIFEMMTQIVFMTREGRVAYCGSTDGLADYIKDDLRMGERIAAGLKLPGGRLGTNDFGALTSGGGVGGGGGGASKSSNPADDLLDVMSVLEPQVLVERYIESLSGAAQRVVLDVLANSYFDPEDPDADDDGAGALRAVGHDSSNDGAVARAADRKLMKKLVAQRGKHISMWPAQFFHLSVRALRNTLRNPFPFFLHGVTAVVASVLIGFTFQDIHSKDNETAGTQDRFGIMFFLCLYLSLLSLTSLPLWRDDQQLFVSERGSGIYSTSPYVMASMLFDVLPYRILPPLAFALIAYPVIDLNDSPGHQFTFFLILCATNLTTSMICMLIGVLTSSNAAANAAGSLAMLTSLLFCGFLLNKKRIPDGFEWILWWSPGNYAYEALVENEFQGLDGLYITSVLADEVIRAGPFTGSNLAHCFGFEDRVGTDVWTLVIMAGVYFTAVLIVMELFIKEKR